MWWKTLIIILLFYFFAILQNSFFAHFSLFGAVPNLIFILFFLIIFFQKNISYYWVIFYSVVSGLFLDIFSYTYFGVSVIILLAIGFLIKKIQLLLKEKKDEYPLNYFLSLFFGAFISYNLLLLIYLLFFDPTHAVINFGWVFFDGIVYNLFFAVIGFYICKKFIKLDINSRQAKLF